MGVTSNYLIVNVEVYRYFYSEVIEMWECRFWRATNHKNGLLKGDRSSPISIRTTLPKNKAHPFPTWIVVCDAGSTNYGPPCATCHSPI